MITRGIKSEHEPELAQQRRDRREYRALPPTAVDQVAEDLPRGSRRIYPWISANLSVDLGEFINMDLGEFRGGSRRIYEWISANLSVDLGVFSPGRRR